jgi:hypothetical protein
MDTVIRTDEDVDRIKREFRYVDASGVPLAAADPAPFAEFNRMPVCLRVIVDQKSIPQILVNCANCAMPIDILWVRINPNAAKSFELTAHDETAVDAVAGGASGSSGSYGGSSTSSGGSYGGSAGGSGSSRGGSSDGNDSSNAPGSDIQVTLDGVGGLYGTDAIQLEIVGSINIYNPLEHGVLQQNDTADTSTP